MWLRQLVIIKETRPSPIHDLEVRCPFFRGLDYFAWHAEECRRFVKGLFTVPAAQLDLTCTVAPRWVGLISVPAQPSLLHRGSGVNVEVPWVPAGEAGRDAMSWICNSFGDRQSVRGQPGRAKCGSGRPRDPQGVRRQHLWSLNPLSGGVMWAITR